MNQDSPRPRRSVLYVPASNRRALEKVGGLDADAIVFDLEDAVAPAMKAGARENLAEAFARGSFGRRETVIRVNAVGTPEFRDDLDAVARCGPDAVLVPKVSAPQELEVVCAAGLDPAVGVWAMIETAAAIASIDAIVGVRASGRARLDCLVVGTNDIAKETGVFPGERRRYLLPWLMQIVLAAKRHRVCVLDGVWNDFSDQRGFDDEALQSMRMGFDGKTLIHPTQVESANRIFAPSAEAVDEARAIVGAFALPENARAGVINLNGKMVERLHAEQAARLLAIHEAIEARARAR